jgi:hypothetical protein
LSTNIRYPNITGLSEKEQLNQVKSYLHQLVDQLNYTLPNLGGSGQTYEVQGEQVSYYELRSLITQQLQEVQGLFDQLSQKMESEYVKDDEVAQLIGTALTDAKESGEFDGPAGPPGPQGTSPVVEVTAIPGGHRITITDSTSTQSFNVMDGGSSSSGLRFELDDGTILY